MTKTDKENAKKDKVRMIVEVASLPRGLSEAGSKRLRQQTLTQLHGYMEDLGDPGERYDDDRIIGMALVGIHAAFLKQKKGCPGEWVQKGSAWYTIFGSPFQRIIDEAVAYTAPPPKKKAGKPKQK